MVARLLWEQDAAGSNPVTSTRKKAREIGHLEIFQRPISFFIFLNHTNFTQFLFFIFGRNKPSVRSPAPPFHKKSYCTLAVRL